MTWHFNFKVMCGMIWYRSLETKQCSLHVNFIGVNTTTGFLMHGRLIRGFVWKQRGSTIEPRANS